MDRHTAERSRWQGPGRLAAAVLLAAMFLTACAEDPKPELSGHFGPGSGGPLVTGPFLTVPITKSSGTVVGYADYDDSYLVGLGPGSTSEFENLVDDATGSTIGVNLSRITGRPDTPCRFQAAILARDEDYEILKSGDRKNSHELDFYQVNLRKGALHLSLFCVSLRDEIGAAIQVITGSAALIDSLQVHYILNSIRKS
jgi:hypothetical protein